MLNFTPYFFYDCAVYDLILSVMYKTCICDQCQVLHFKKKNAFLLTFNEPLHALFNIKWFIICLIGCYYKVFYFNSYLPKNLVFDKEMQMRLFSFYCCLIGVSLIIINFEIAWVSLAVTYNEEPNCIAKIDKDFYDFMSKYFPN